MRVGVLYSGGKDSTFAAYLATLYGWEVCCLISLKSRNSASYMFHTPNIELVKLQAQAMEIPLVFHETSGEKEKELTDLHDALAFSKKKYHLSGIVAGALYSDYQQERVNRVCYDLDLKTFAPQWHVAQDFLVKEMIDLGFEIIFSAVAAEGFDEHWLGRRFDASTYQELLKLHERSGIHIAGEGGEYESLVLDCPLFKKRIVVRDAGIVMESSCSGVYVINEAVLEINH